MKFKFMWGMRKWYFLTWTMCIIYYILPVYFSIWNQFKWILLTSRAPRYKYVASASWSNAQSNTTTASNITRFPAIVTQNSEYYVSWRTSNWINKVSKVTIFPWEDRSLYINFCTPTYTYEYVHIKLIYKGTHFI